MCVWGGGGCERERERERINTNGYLLQCCVILSRKGKGTGYKIHTPFLASGRSYGTSFEVMVVFKLFHSFILWRGVCMHVVQWYTA